MDTPLRLSDVLGRSVVVEWFEAVAIVREVAERLQDGVPELDQVQISPDGNVSVTGTARKDDPVRRLGQLLQVCLVQAEPPVQLRLAASQATAPEPAFTSVRELSEALAYFERPNRSAVLRQLYQRAESAPSSAMAQTPTLDAIAPLQLEPGKKAGTRPLPPTPRPSRRGVLALAAGVVLVVTTTTYSRLSPGVATTSDVSGIVVKASDAVGATLVKGISAVSESVGLGRLAPAETSPSMAAAAAIKPQPSATEPARRRPVNRPSPASVPFKLFDLEATGPMAVGSPVSLPTIGAAATGGLSAAVNTPAPQLDETIYSAADPAIAPPIGVRPQLPRVLPDDISQDRLSQIELIVQPDGTVGSVKLLGRRRSVPEAMLLSAAKAWQFKPALKDGRPVKYRKIVWLVRE